MSEQRRPLLIMGSGGLVAEAADVAEDIGLWDVEGFISPEKIDLDEIGGKPVYPLSEAIQMAATHHTVCAQVATNRDRFIEKAIESKFQFCSLVHPSAHVSRTATIGSGVIIGANAVILSHSRIADHAIILANATVSHHARVGSYSTVAAGATLAGLTTIGSNTFVGINASILPERHVGNFCFVGAGSVVNKDVPDHRRAVGNPARIR
ncbi:MAG: hypothetical protein DWQ08_09185 [Proteobacteria bacterium]|nr:MAG: hypothetical protein DWQ08_09185 [Pseudomonadota bacterium]